MCRPWWESCCRSRPAPALFDERASNTSHEPTHRAALSRRHTQRALRLLTHGLLAWGGLRPTPRIIADDLLRAACHRAACRA